MASITLFGIVMFKWFPGQGVAFEGQGTATGNIYDNVNFDFLVEDISWGSCFLTNFDGKSFKGILNGQCLIGEINVPVSHIEFELCNLREFNGRPVKVSTSGFSNNLLVLENDCYEIKLFKHIDFSIKNKGLKWKGNYQTLYSGKLKTKRNQTLTYGGTNKVFDTLSLFLSFLNGRRTSPIFRKGIFEDEAIWSDYTPYHVDTHKSVHSWPPQSQVTAIENVWPKFHKLHRDENSKGVLDVAIFTYLRANGHVAQAFEGVAIIANTLELLFNYLIVETKKIISGKDIENLQASNKIRLLLSQVGIENDIPDTLSEIKQFQKSSDAFSQLDGPEIFVQIRNSIVHGQLEKRRNLAKIPNTVIWEVSQMGIWYVEVILLYIIEYKGIYRNRVLNAQFTGDGEETMPYLKDKIS
jgi:hypothetical protein